MTLGSRGQLHQSIMCVLICAYTKYHQAILHNIDASRAYTLCAKHVTFKVHGSVFLILASILNT